VKESSANEGIMFSIEILEKAFAENVVIEVGSSVCRFALQFVF
jgi:hypothetical protein